MAMDNNTNHNEDNTSPHTCFRNWMDLQEQDLSELLQAINLHNNNGDEDNDNDNDNDASSSSSNHDHAPTPSLHGLIDKAICHFEDYAAQRATIARRTDVSPYFAPTWCSSLEGSMLWVGGCRPSTFIRLAYALSGADLLSHMEQVLRGGATSRCGGLGELTAAQITEINSLQLRTIEQEEKISKTLAGLQEDMADQPIAIIVRDQRVRGEPSTAADEALDRHSEAMMKVLEDSDKLRMDTLKEMISILTPVQGVNFLSEAKKLHLCLHAWGRRRDGRSNGRR